MQKMLILSGPSGSGKSTLYQVLKKEFPHLYFSISTTTRIPREGEQHGREYFFVTKEDFLQDVKNDRFLEWAQVHQNYYGTSKKPIEQALLEGRLIVFDVDVQGHRNIKKYYPFAKSVFITTPTDLILKQRLQQRQSESKQDLEHRLGHAYKEMEAVGEFDFLIINDDIKKASKQILGIAHGMDCCNFDALELMRTWKTN
ncbi:guanylate kinase [Helicobacter mustelae]|uniref:Guanylate kinase n=1 Tax=Helicobacter mustelae (strain ATCC 43772 / CCUG 25715 / CIP 103759 / LMG 18044 / NCTC 12198 / R85-136P) TaxID=679897 RepID=D3UG71_HELM1|nr:guanylate kinase [Helicobacter mustelae]CBG39492.1 guanylate kinase [Helicobacter mustelae 12198]SQH71004.1 guanylate kinase [Helicobacter mustelae]STP12133.1 guanylate kinase [Helicobacter mustelae]